MDDIAFVDIAEQRRRRLAHRLRQLPQIVELASGAGLVHVIVQRRRDQIPANRRSQRFDLRRRHDAIGDAEEDHGDAVIVRRLLDHRVL